MASVVTWNLSVEELEIGKSVEFTAAGLDSYEGMVVLIQLPNGSHFSWGVQSDSNGRVRDSIKLDSGLGQYLFCPKPACGNVVPQCKHINVCPCGTSKTGCDVRVEGPSQILTGAKVSYMVSGLAPSKLISAKISNNEQVSYDLNGISDTYGNFLFEFTHNLAGIYSLTFSDGSCNSAPKIVEVINSQNETPRLQAERGNPCNSAVDLSLVFSKANYAFGESGYLKASVCNRGPEFRDIFLGTAFIMPGATITSQPIPTQLGLSGFRCEEYTILFTAGTSDENYTAQFYGSYECGERPYVANGGSTNATVGVGTGTCAAVLKYFMPEGGVTAVTVDEEVTLEVQVLNTGNKIIEYASVLGLMLPEHVTAVTAFPANSAAIPPGQTETIKIKVKIDEPGDYTIKLVADKLMIKCSGNDIYIGSVGYITLTASAGGDDED